MYVFTELCTYMLEESIYSLLIFVLYRGVVESKTDLRSCQNCKPILIFNGVTESD